MEDFGPSRLVEQVSSCCSTASRGNKENCCTLHNSWQPSRTESVSPTLYGPSQCSLIHQSSLCFQQHEIFVRTNLRYWTHPNLSGGQSVMVTHYGLCLIGSMIAISLTLLSHSRWFCLVAATEGCFGFTNLLAASQGLCILLHKLSLWSIRPWERKSHGHGLGHLSYDVEASFCGGSIKYSETKSCGL